MSLRTELKNTLLKDVLLEVTGNKDNNKKYSVLVVDPHSSKILSSCLRMFDLMENGILVIQNIELPREHLPAYPALYLLEPTQANMTLIMNDFATQPMYSAANLFFTGHLKTDLMKQLGASKAVKYVKKLVELNIDFVAFESKVFSFELPALNNLYLSQVDKLTLSKELSVFSRKLASVCLTMGEVPHIRYQGSGLKAILAKSLARFLSDYLRKHTAKLPDFKANDGRQRGTLLIVDRSIDVLSPLMHEFTYQAMVQDLLNVHGEIVEVKNKLKEEKKNDIEGNNNNKQTLVLSEDDQLWCELRHNHIASVSNTVTSKYKDFLGKNAAAAHQKKRKNKEDASFKDMLEAMKQYPQFKTMSAVYEKHFSIAGTVMNEGSSDFFLSMARLEQDMATGLNEQGKKISKEEVLASLATLCNDKRMNMLCKLRLLMIYSITYGAIEDETRLSLMNSSPSISIKMQKAFLNLQQLGVDLGDTKKKPNVVKKKKEVLTGDKNLYGNTLRHTPVLKDICKDLLTGKLDDIDYPYIDSSDVKKKEKVKESGKFVFRRAEPNDNNNGNNNNNNENDNRVRNFIFMIGGVTFSEIRSAYEVINNNENAKTNTLLIGSNELLTPNNFLKQMAQLNEEQFNKEVETSNKNMSNMNNDNGETGLNDIEILENIDSDSD